MIQYLEQLERDLVEAIDRREAGRSGFRTWKARVSIPRLDLAVVAAIAALALGIATIALLNTGTHDQHPALPPPTKRGHERPTPIGPRTPLRLVATLSRVNTSTWSGPARGPGGAGDLALIGAVRLIPTTCCTTPRNYPSAARGLLRFRWNTSQGTLTGCIETTIYRRPHNRWVWDGAKGRVSNATGALRRYRGRAMAISGETPTSAPDRARIILGGNGPGPPTRC